MTGEINSNLWEGVCAVTNRSLKMEMKANRQEGLKDSRRNDVQHYPSVET